MDQVAAMMPHRIEDAVKGTPISVVANVVDPLRIEAFIAFLLTKEVADMWNGDQRLNLQGHQIPTIAKTLMDTFKNENLADFTICFRRGVMGLYNDEKDKLLRIDGAVIVGWMRKYLDEKYQVIENSLMKEKDNPYAALVSRSQSDDQINHRRNLLAAMETVIGGKDAGIDLSKHLTEEQLKEIEQARLQSQIVSANDNASENAYQRYKVAEPQRELTIEQLRKVLRQEYPEATTEQIEEVIAKSRRK